jgi:hypothetical protein
VPGASIIANDFGEPPLTRSADSGAVFRKVYKLFTICTQVGFDLSCGLDYPVMQVRHFVISLSEERTMLYKTLKSIRMLSIVTVLLLTLAACGGNAPAATTAPGNTSESAATTADAAVRGFLDSLYSGTGQPADFICSAVTAEQRTQMEDGFKQVAAAFTSTGATVDTSGLTYTITNETADSATVEVGGNLSVDVSGTKTDVPLSGMAVPVKKEGDAWKVCS